MKYPDYRKDEVEALFSVFSKDVDITKFQSKDILDILNNTSADEFKTFLIEIYLTELKEATILRGGKNWCKLIDRIMNLRDLDLDSITKELNRNASIYKFLGEDK